MESRHGLYLLFATGFLLPIFQQELHKRLCNGEKYGEIERDLLRLCLDLILFMSCLSNWCLKNVLYFRKEGLKPEPFSPINKNASQ